MFKRASTEARTELREARADLERVSSGITEETDIYVAANQRVINAEKAVRDSRKRS